MSIDLEQVLRRRKPAKHIAQIRPRSGRQLVDLAQLTAIGPLSLLLDTNVYINLAAGRITPQAYDIIDRALLFHSSTALAEITVGIANADPSGPKWRSLRDYYCRLFAAIPSTRLLTPDSLIWAEAGVIAGTLARTQGFMAHQRQACLNDALIFLTAAKVGVPVLTSDRNDFDRIQQIAPDGRFVHYATSVSPA